MYVLFEIVVFWLYIDLFVVQENDTPKINKKIKQEKGESNATDDLFMVLVEPKVKQLLGRPLLNKLKPKELKLMGRQYHTLFDEYDVS